MAETPTSTKSAAGASKPPATASAEEMTDVEKLLDEEIEKVEKAEKAEKAEREASAASGKGSSEKHSRTKKKKGGKGKDRPSLGARISEGIGSLQTQFAEIVRGLVSPDGPTRVMSFLFFVSLAGVIALGVLTVQRKVRLEREREAQELAAREEAAEQRKEAELLGKTEVVEEDLHALSMLNLGQFTLELKPVPGRIKTSGFMNMAEVELVVECDSKATHDYIEANLVQARSQITDILLSIDREELLSRDGKRKLKKRLLERINGWIPSGKVQNVFFSKLVVA